ncbi:phage holin family protein [Thermoleophilia bacterium SCSIO 60948]|nr:phage holin family protein [Thermoleophilia bacterium SCSIO 60948]
MSPEPEPRPVAEPRKDDPSQLSVGELVIDVSERTSGLVREEIALAKAEVSEKVSKLVKGSVVGIAAGIFALLGLAMIMHAFAWLLNDLFFGDNVWLGFLVEAVLFFVIAAIAGLVAFKAVKGGAPPTPDMAIEEAKRTKQTLSGSTTPEPVAKKAEG